MFIRIMISEMSVRWFVIKYKNTMWTCQVIKNRERSIWYATSYSDDIDKKGPIERWIEQPTTGWFIFLLNICFTEFAASYYKSWLK